MYIESFKITSYKENDRKGATGPPTCAGLLQESILINLMYLIFIIDAVQLRNSFRIQ